MSNLKDFLEGHDEVKHRDNFQTHKDFPVKKCPECGRIYEYAPNNMKQFIYRAFPMKSSLKKETCPDCQGKDVMVIRSHTMNQVNNK